MGEVLRFGNGWEVDGGLHELRHRGLPISIKPRALDVLTYLIAHRDRIVSRDELLDHVWGGITVGEGSVSSALHLVRRALEGCDPSGQDVIETIRGRGLRFRPIVESVASPRLKRPAAVQGDAPPFVGRRAILQDLDRAWVRAQQGRGQLVLLHGELGIGKSRTARVFVEQVGVEHTYHGQCYAGSAAPAFWPWLELIRSMLEDRPVLAEGPAASVLAELAPVMLHQANASTRGSVPDPHDRRFHYSEALSNLIIHAAREQPIVLVLDDLHWADPGSLALLELLAGRLCSEALLVLATYRDAAPSALATSLGHLATGECFHSHSLLGLSRGEIAALLRLQLGATPEPALVDAALRRTDGNPFYLTTIAHELALHSSGSADAAAWERTMPTELRQAVIAMLSELPAETRTVLDAAAVIGQAFSLDLLRRVVSEEPEQVSVVLDWLEPAIECSAVHPSRDYRDHLAFEHGLYREVIYEALAPTTRAYLHRRAGEALRSLHEPRDARECSELARHLGEGIAAGGDRLSAVEASLQVARFATAAAGWEQVEEETERALSVLEGVAGSLRRDRLELDLLMERVPAMTLRKGYVAIEVGQAAARALALNERVRDAAYRPVIQTFVLNFDMMRARYDRTETLAHTFEGEQAHASERRFSGNVLVQKMLIALMRGDLQAAVAFSDASRATDPALQLEYSRRLGQDLEVTRRVALANVLWISGRRDAALNEYDATLTRSERLDRPYSRGYALNFGAFLCQLRGDAEGVLARTDELLPLAAERGFVTFLGMGHAVAGWARCALGQLDNGLAQLEAATSAIEASQSRLLWSYFLGMRAECRILVGNTLGAEQDLERALAFAAERGEHVYEPELHRLRGELALAKGAEPELAADCFCRAVQAAVERDARAFELRARLRLSDVSRSRIHNDELADFIAAASPGDFEPAEIERAQGVVSHGAIWRMV